MRVLCDNCDKVCNLRRNVNGNKFICWTCKNDKIKIQPRRYKKYKLFPKNELPLLRVIECFGNNYYELFPKNEWPLPRVIECLSKKLIY